MPRARKPAQYRLQTPIDQGLAAQVNLYLYSPVEQRVPYGAWTKFLETLIRNHFELLKGQINEAVPSAQDESGAATGAGVQPVQATATGGEGADAQA